MRAYLGNSHLSKQKPQEYLNVTNHRVYPVQLPQQRMWSSFSPNTTLKNYTWDYKIDWGYVLSPTDLGTLTDTNESIFYLESFATDIFQNRVI